MESFLKDNKLDHLCDALAAKLTVNEAIDLLAEGRPALLAKCKELGVRKPPDLSAFAKAVANGKRELTGTGVPLIICTYSAGMTSAGGRSLMKPLLEKLKGAGLPDSMVFDNHNEAPYDKLKTFDQYIIALSDAIKAEPISQGRPLIFLAHSHGANAAYGLARAFGPRARALIILGRRSPAQELLGDVFGEPSCKGVGEMAMDKFAVRLGEVYSNATLVVAAQKDPDPSKWIPGMRDSAMAAMAQYSSPVSMTDINDIVAVFGEGVRTGPEQVDPKCVLNTPIFGYCAKEEPNGETAEKMQKWASLTSAGFTLKSFECLHMELPRDDAVIKAVVETCSKLVSGPVAIS